MCSMLNLFRPKLSAHAMAFYHQDGLPSAWEQATKYAGDGGRLATMPDIVAARLATKPGEDSWERYYTTITAEYYGLSQAGKPILIIAHGVGPMSSLDGVRQAYSWEYKDKVQRSRRGGRITSQEFLALETGKYGPVEVIDLESYCRRYRYPFLQHLRLSEALTDPVLKARFGPRTEEYVQAHAEYARVWHRQQKGLDPKNKYHFSGHQEFLSRRRDQHYQDGAEGSDPFILGLKGPSNCCYFFGFDHLPHSLQPFREIEAGMAITHLVSTGGLCHCHHEGNESLILDVGCHEWGDGVRLVGIKVGGSTEPGLQPSPNARELLHKHWRGLLVPVDDPEIIGFRALIRINKQWFTQYPKKGERMDTHEPEYVVTKIEKVGEPVLFRTTTGGGFFFKFGIKEVEAIAPTGANAYHFVGDPQKEGDKHETCMVQFYRITADTTKRLVRVDDLSRDFGRMMWLMAKGSGEAQESVA